jgi:hypothetical protein
MKLKPVSKYNKVVTSYTIHNLYYKPPEIYSKIKHEVEKCVCDKILHIINHIVLEMDDKIYSREKSHWF